jgi:hypothetical protein
MRKNVLGIKKLILLPKIFGDGGGSMGLFKKKIVKKTYDREHMKPVIRASICTGEEVAGFKDIRTGKIEEIMLIRSPEDLEKFKEIYEITEEIAKEY